MDRSLTTARVRPFPWASLDAVTADELATLRRLSALAGSGSARGAAAASLATLLGTDVSFRPFRTHVTAPPADEPSLAVDLEIDRERVVVEVEPALVVDVVARALKRAPPLTLAADAAALANAGGAFAALLVRTLRAAFADANVRVVGVGPAPLVLARSEIADPAAIVFTVLVDIDAHRARVVFSRSARAMQRRAPVDRRALSTLAELPLAVPVIGALGWSTARELATLAPGDVWLGKWAGASRNDVLLAAPRSSRALTARLEDARRLVLGTQTEDLTMSDAASDTILDSALDAPVVVRVELGMVELTAREWADLKPGDVISTGTRVGAQVILRAGGAEIGRGELVDVDGEVGVRIASIGGAR